MHTLRSYFLAFALAVVCTLSLRADEPRQVSVHDPAMAKEGDTYYLFSTGPGITYYSSKDLQTWKLVGRIFPGNPSWAKSVAPSFNGHIWAPDVIFHNGTFHVYYSVSAFGKNTSAIGLTTNKTLNPKSPDYRWEDHGIVVESVPNRDLWNAIDPNIAVDESGTAWMAFGSFWSGLKLVKLNDDWTAPAKPEVWYSLAKRERSVLIDDRNPGPAQLEAPFIFHKNGYYYLFLSWDRCCIGIKSNYKIVIGRSKEITGPYLDKDGRNLAEGGGTILLQGNPKWPGVGHNSTYTFDEKDYMIFHAYEAADKGLQKLKIAQLSWDKDEWPVVDPSILDTYKSAIY